jgi:hypothetical protein
MRTIEGYVLTRCEDQFKFGIRPSVAEEQLHDDLDFAQVNTSFQSKKKELHDDFVNSC